MDKKLQKKLFTKYPHFFRDRKKSSKASRMHDGICCGDGWYNLIDQMCNKLLMIRKLSGVDIKYLQIKEKLARLVIYYECSFEKHHEDVSIYEYKHDVRQQDQDTIIGIIRSVVYSAEQGSSCICEKCGNTRMKTKILDGGLFGYCDLCFKKLKKEISNK